MIVGEIELNFGYSYYSCFHVFNHEVKDVSLTPKNQSKLHFTEVLLPALHHYTFVAPQNQNVHHQFYCCESCHEK